MGSRIKCDLSPGIFQIPQSHRGSISDLTPPFWLSLYLAEASWMTVGQRQNLTCSDSKLPASRPSDSTFRAQQRSVQAAIRYLAAYFTRTKARHSPCLLQLVVLFPQDHQPIRVRRLHHRQTSPVSLISRRTGPMPPTYVSAILTGVLRLDHLYDLLACESRLQSPALLWGEPYTIWRRFAANYTTNSFVLPASNAGILRVYQRFYAGWRNPRISAANTRCPPSITRSVEPPDSCASMIRA